MVKTRIEYNNQLEGFCRESPEEVLKWFVKTGRGVSYFQYYIKYCGGYKTIGIDSLFIPPEDRFLHQEDYYDIYPVFEEDEEEIISPGMAIAKCCKNLFPIEEGSITKNIEEEFGYAVERNLWAKSKLSEKRCKNEFVREPVQGGYEMVNYFDFEPKERKLKLVDNWKIYRSPGEYDSPARISCTREALFHIARIIFAIKKPKDSDLQRFLEIYRKTRRPIPEFPPQETSSYSFGGGSTSADEAIEFHNRLQKGLGD